MATTDILKIDSEMLNRTDSISETKYTPSIMDTIHKVYIYNPNYSNWEVMDESKKWKFKVKEANTWNEVYIDSFKFWLIDLVKVMSWKLIYKDEFWDTIIWRDWKPVSDYFYTNEYPVICKWDHILAFRNLRNDSDILYFKKRDLINILRLPKINWKRNDFSVLKTKQDWSTYRSSSVMESFVMYWVFLDWPYAWEYFIFYPKDNLIWYNYSKWQYVKPEEWTLTAIMEKALEWWNDIRKQNWLAPVKNMPYSLVDLKISTYIKDVAWKLFNVWKLEFAWYTALRWNNKPDLDYISEFRRQLFEERFGWIKQPLSVVYIDKTWRELIQYSNDLQIVDCKIEYDFSYKVDKNKLLKGGD